MQSVDEIFPLGSAEESITTKDWAAGSFEVSDSREFLLKKAGGRYTASYETIHVAPALTKIIDEPLVNAIDHVVRTLGGLHPVLRISVSISPAGQIRIYNDGAGVPIGLHRAASAKFGRDTWSPTLIFAKLFQGSNAVHKDSIIGGTNGLGSKITNFASSEFIIETCDGVHFFQQKFENRNKVEHPPVVLRLDDPQSKIMCREQHTTVAFVPDYVGLFGYDSYNPELHQLLTDLTRTRVFMAAAYVNSVNPRCQVYFNDELVPVKSMADIAHIVFPECKRVITMVKPTSAAPYDYVWEVCAVVAKSSTCEYPQLTNVNGVVVKDGKHVNKIRGCVVEGVRAHIEKLFSGKNIKFQPRYVTANLFMFINAKIPNVHWNGQRKDILDIDIRKLAGYAIDPKTIDHIAAALGDVLTDQLLVGKASKRKKAVKIDKYKEAGGAGGKKSADCALFLFEGDSAFDQGAAGLASDTELNGLFSLGGVIMNVRKQCEIMKNSAGDSKIVLKTKLAKNVRFNALLQATGLDVNARYDPESATYKQEMRALNYGCVVACVDQDLDGKGFILGLILNMFELFWPNLIKAGFVKWFPSPIIRAYPRVGVNVLEFYTLSEYDRWAATGVVDRYDIKYLKGLGSNDEDETAQMYRNVRSKLITFYGDERSHNAFEIYFGELPDLRKRQLSSPPPEVSPEEIEHQLRSKTISCTTQLETETDAFQRDNLERKLDHVVDGQNQAGRKILDGVIKAFGAKNKMRKVAQLAGYVSEHEAYHHGEQSNEKSITGRGFVAVGGKQIPILVPHSNFGSRMNGPDGAASARYIWCTLNDRVVHRIFPPEDYYLLEFNEDDGKRVEPRYFVPTIPMAVLESTELPGHGWKLQTWGRDVFAVIKSVRRLIRAGDDARLLAAPPARCAGSKYEWKGEFRYVYGELYSMGTYEITAPDTVLITELPLRQWSEPYQKRLTKKAEAEDSIIDDIKDLGCDVYKVRIQVRFKPGKLQTLEGNQYVDGVEEFLKLRERLITHLNLTMPDNTVREFATYEDAIHVWFPYRKALYGARIERQRELGRLNILRLTNILRYLRAKLKTRGKRRAEIEQMLEEMAYDRMNVGKLRTPKFIPTAQLEDVIVRGKKASFMYLVKLHDWDKSAEGIAEYEAELAEARAAAERLEAQASIGRFPGAAVWEAELDDLEAQIREGFRTGWRYGAAGKYKFV